MDASAALVVLETALIEDSGPSDRSLQMDFANRYLGGGALGAGCVPAPNAWVRGGYDRHYAALARALGGVLVGDPPGPRPRAAPAGGKPCCEHRLHGALEAREAASTTTEGREQAHAPLAF